MYCIDLGSNTFRVAHYDCESGERLDEFEKNVKTADRLHETGVVSQEALDNVVLACKEARQKFGFSPEECVAVTTAALRKAKNQKKALDYLLKETGICFRVIDGQDEAKLTAIAVEAALKKLEYEKNFVLIDIGGGSTEVIFWKEQNMISESFPIGIVAVAQKYRTRDNIALHLPPQMDEVREFVTDMKHTGFRPDIFVATAGTPATVAAMMLGMDYEHYDYRKINGRIVTAEDCDRELARLLRCDTKSREKMVGVGRSELIIAGILIYKELFDVMGFESCVVVDDGLREGLALAHCRGLM